MNSILARIQTNKFYTLIPIVLLFTYALAYFFRMLLIVFFQAGPPSLSSSVQGRTPRQEVIRSLNFYEEIVTGNLVRGISLEAGKERTISGDAQADVEPLEDDSEVDPMVLTGTLSGDISFARATLRDKSGSTMEYSIGETLGSYKIRSIEQHFITLRKGKLVLKVEIGESIAQAKEKIQKKDKGEEVEKLTSSETIQKVLSREDVNRKLKDPNVIYKDARFGPHIVDGKIEGYKLYQVARSHIFYSLGARSGDIIKRVNGMPLSDTEKMLELWNSIKSATKVTVDVDRKGKIITYEFIIRN